MSSFTISCVVITGPREISLRGLVQQALGRSRQFESVANTALRQKFPECADLHCDAKLFKIVAWVYHLRGCKGFDKCTLRKESLFLQTYMLGKPCYDFYFL